VALPSTEISISGTGLFDQSSLETILDYADFPIEADWFRIEGRMTKLIEVMAEKIKKKSCKAEVEGESV